MRYFETVQPYSATDNTPEWNILSENEIINSIYGDYCCLMYLTRLGHLPTREQILENWSVTYWADELK